jgi:hypothetical protein
MEFEAAEAIASEHGGVLVMEAVGEDTFVPVIAWADIESDAVSVRLVDLNSGQETVLLVRRDGWDRLAAGGARRDQADDFNPCAVCGYAGTCGDPPGSDCHS